MYSEHKDSCLNYLLCDSVATENQDLPKWYEMDLNKKTNLYESGTIC